MADQPPHDPTHKPPEEPSPAGPRSFTVDLSQGLDQALEKLRERAGHYVKKGQHTQVRVKFRGKELATMPLGVMLAAEAATFFWAGPLRLILANALGRSFLEVEFVNEADTVVAQGKARLLDGELDEALARFRDALTMDKEHPAAHLNLGIALKLKGERDEAQTSFETAARLDPEGDVGKEARRQLEKLRARS